MFELSQEELLLFSNDGSVELTTHRIIQRSEEGNNEIMLEDFENYEFKTAHIGNYYFITIVLIIVSILITLFRIKEYFLYIKNPAPPGNQNFAEFMADSFLIRPALFLLALSLVFLVISRRYLVSLNGKYNRIQFRVANPYNRTIKKFLNAIVSQSNKVKKESILPDL